jgi:hypothetical protein
MINSLKSLLSSALIFRLAEFGPGAVVKLGLWKPGESINLATPDRNYEL